MSDRFDYPTRHFLLRRLSVGRCVITFGGYIFTPRAISFKALHYLILTPYIMARNEVQIHGPLIKAQD